MIDIAMCILLGISIVVALGCLIALEVGDRKKTNALNNKFWASAKNGDKHYSYNDNY